MTTTLRALASITVIIFLFIAHDSSVAATNPPGKIIWQIEEQFVSVVPQDSSTASANDHPAEVPEDTIAEILYAISVGEKRSRFSFGGKKADLGIPLFSEYEIEVLSRIFVEALKTASPREDILFRIHGGREQLGGITKRKTINTGRAFWLDNQLHIIFGEVHSGDKTKWVYGQKQEDKYIRKFGSRTSESDRVDIVFAPVPGIVQYKDNNNKVRLDWITIDPNVVLGKTTESEQTVTNSLPTANNVNIAVPASANQHLPLKQRLSELKELREEGLISEEIYQQKVKELVDETY